MPSQARLKCNHKCEVTKPGPVGRMDANLSELRSSSLRKASRAGRDGGSVCCHVVCGGVQNVKNRIVSAIDKAVRRTQFYDKKERSDPYYAFDRECARLGVPKMPSFLEVVKQPSLLNNRMAILFGHIAKVDLARAVGVHLLSRDQIETLSRRIDRLANAASSESTAGWVSKCGEKFAREHLAVRIVNEL